MRCFLRHVGLLLWRQWLEAKRNLFLLMAEIALPTFIAFLLALVVRMHARVEYHDIKIWPAFRIRDRLPLVLNTRRCNGSRPSHFMLAYVPNNAVMDQIIHNVTDRLSSGVERQALGFESEEKMEQYLQELDSCTRTNILAAVVMTSDFPNNKLPQDMSYKLRPLSEIRLGPMGVTSLADWRTMLSFPSYRAVGPRQKTRIKGGLPDYYSQGFLTLQRAVDFALISHHNQSTAKRLDKVTVRLQRHAYPAYREDRFINILGAELPLLLFFSFFLSVPIITKQICLEKERKQKEFCELHGLRSTAADMALCTKYFIIYTLSAALNTLFLYLPTRYGGLLNYTSASVLFVMIVLYATSLVAFSAFVSAFFNKALYGVVANDALQLITYVPFFYMQFRLNRYSVGVRMWTSLFPNMAMAYAGHYVAAMEGRAVGIHWDTINMPVVPEINHTMLHCFLFFLLDIFLYSVLAWFFSNTLPREHGIPRPCYFPFTKQFWYGSSSREKDGDEQNFTCISDYFEGNDSTLKTDIRMINLEMAYLDTNNPVVSGFSMAAFRGQIIALIGRNGSGKTTIVSLLTGFRRPNAGEIYVCGYNMVKNTENARSSLGYCPKEDILYDFMTVREHLVYFTKLKGVTKRVTDEVERYIKSLHLENSRYIQARSLSRAQRRKLAIGIAFIGDSKCVVLDAPTDGMDSVSQRQVWQLISREKANRTILITTQSMEEAQTLADRIAIISRGAVLACGSPQFLKRKFCDEYTLSVVSKSNSDMKSLLDNIQAQTPSAQLQFSSGRRLVFSFSRSTFTSLLGLIKYIETNKSNLGILNIKADTSTMDDVLIKATQTTERLIETNLATDFINSTFPTSTRDDRLSGLKLFLHRIITMFHHRAMTSMRNAPFFLGNIFLVVVFVVSGCTIAICQLELEELPPYSLSVDNFRRPSAPYLLRDANRSGVVGQLGLKYSEVLKATKASDPPLVNDEPWFVPNSTIDHYLLRNADRDMGHYVYDLITAATFTDGRLRVRAKGHFNNEAFHASAISLNLISNTLAKYLLGDSYSIRATNHPLPRDRRLTLSEPYNPNSLETLILAFCTMFGFVFLTSSFAPFLVRDRKLGVKRLQQTSGARTPLYWSSTFLWDYIVLFSCGLLTIAIFLAFQLDAFMSCEAVGALLVGFALYGWAAIPLNYILSYSFDVPAAAYGWITAFQTACSTVVIIAMKILLSPSLGVVHEARITEWVLYSLLPHYALQNIIVEMTTNLRNRQYCTTSIPSLNMSRAEICEYRPNFVGVCCPGNCGNFCAPYADSAFSFYYPGIGRGLMFLSIQGLLFFVVIAIIESNIVHRIRNRPAKGEGQIEKWPNDDRLDASRDVIVTYNLSKHYGITKAINAFSFGLHQGEMLAVVGVNGAGKSTLLKVLTGEATLTSGEALINGIRISRSKKRFLGYCSQRGEPAYDMTIRQVLAMYTGLRGLHKRQQIRHIIDDLLSKLDLIPQADRDVAHLSDGDKKKVSLAVSLIADPPVVLLDDPVVGLDPVSKARVWQTVVSCSLQNTAVLVTSQSFDECSPVAGRIGVLVNGCLRALDNTEHLADCHSDGYTLTVRILPSQNNTMGEAMAQNTGKIFQEYIKVSFPGARLKAQQQETGLLTYKIAYGTRFSDILQKIETLQEKYHIVDYSLSLVSLEQEFLEGFSQAGKSLANNHANDVKELREEYECLQNFAQTSAAGQNPEDINCKNHYEMLRFQSLDNDTVQVTYM